MSSTTAMRNLRPARLTVLTLGLGANGVVGVGGDSVVVSLKGNLYAFESCAAAVLCLVVLIREEDVGQVDHATRDVNRF